MKVLYAAYNHDPRQPNLSSGADYNFYTAIQNTGAEVVIALPNLGQTFIVERILQLYYKRIMGKRYAKFPLTKVKRASASLNEKVEQYHPDVVFTIFPPTIVNYKSKVPCVFRLDTTFWGWQQEYPEFSRLGLFLSIQQERRAFAHCTRIITHSDWTKQILMNAYGVSEEKVVVFPNPALLPNNEHVQFCDKVLSYPLQLLFVGKDYDRKGLDIALEVVKQLNDQDVPSRLVVCGNQRRKSNSLVNYVGYFNKSDPKQWENYINLYRQAHLLIHPARFDPSPIVTSEAAAFGLPTITNANGGLATSVKHNVSGIVLPKWSCPEVYVESIKCLVKKPKQYAKLRVSTRHRYLQELSWEVAGNQLGSILNEVTSNRQ